MTLIYSLLLIYGFISITSGNPFFDNGDHKRHTRQTTHCTLEIEANPPSCTCRGVSLDEISVESLGDDADVIRSMSIIGSSLEILPASAFAHLPALTDLTIARSGVQKLETDAFLGVEGLSRLNLSRNEITNLDEPYFTLLKDLKKLNISGNTISSIGINGFDGLRSLQVLDLSSNTLTTLPAALFQKTPNLRSLDFSKNQIARLPTGLFGKLDYLLAVDLSKNKLVQLPNRLFGTVPNLSRLVISYNNLRTINADAFAQNQMKLTLLRIDYNEISWVDTPSLAIKLPALQKASIAPNPWRCSCYNAISQWLQVYNVHTFVKDFSEGKLPICVAVAPVLTGRQIATTNECKRPSEQEGAVLRTTYRNLFNDTRSMSRQLRRA